jgi:hypothetical protein
MSDIKKYRVIDAETVEALQVLINRLAEEDYRAVNISSYLVNTANGLEYQLMALMEHKGSKQD